MEAVVRSEQYSRRGLQGSMRILVRIPVEVLLVDVDVQPGTLAEQFVPTGVGDVPAVDIERLETVDPG
jgi:hypothetical protein